MNITFAQITAKVRASRPIYNIKGERIELSSEQQRVIRLICQGLRYKQIAHELGTTERAIKHISSVLQQAIGFKSQAQLGAWAAKQGIV